MSKIPVSPVREVKITPAATVVVLQGELDMHRAPDLREAFTEVIKQRPPRLIADFGDVRYLDSTGLGTFVYFLKEVKSYGGKMALAGLNPTVRNVLEITKLDKVFSVFPTVNDALRAFEGKASAEPAARPAR